jgi:hypothetical protein
MVFSLAGGPLLTLDEEGRQIEVTGARLSRAWWWKWWFFSLAWPMLRLSGLFVDLDWFVDSDFVARPALSGEDDTKLEVGVLALSFVNPAAACTT